MLSVIPAPAHLDFIDEADFVLSSSVAIHAPRDLEPLARWFAAELATATGLSLAVEPDGPEPGIRLELVPEDPAIADLPVPLGVRADDRDATGERHAIEVRTHGVRIVAAAPEGAFRALTTLLQIAEAGELTDDDTIELPAVTIRDAPRFAWRGLSFDVVRRAYTVEEVRRVIDLLALYKANVLHLHLTDAEGWRIQIDSWPDLAEVGGRTAARNRPGGFYTGADYSGLVRYARERFITIVPEIEMPGHAAAVLRAYPELSGTGDGAPPADSGRGPWFEVMNPNNPRIVPFITDVLTEVASMTPGAYLHLGGDEALGMDRELYQQFMRQARSVAYSLGKKVVAWQETARSGFGPDDIAQLWISPGQGDLTQIDLADIPEDFELPPDPEALMAAFAEFLELAHTDLDTALGQGARILVSQQSKSYLDTKYREESSDPGQMADQSRLGMPFYPKSTVAEFYAWDPATIRPSLGERSIAGVEAAIWSETIETLDDLFFLLLPRLPGILEKGWSPAVGSDDGWLDYAPRLAAQAHSWEVRGWLWFRSSLVWPEAP